LPKFIHCWISQSLYSCSWWWR